MTARPLRRTLLVATALVHGPLAGEGSSPGDVGGGPSALDTARAGQPLDGTARERGPHR